MSDSPLIVKSKAFALEVIQVCKELRVAKCESTLKKCSETEYWIELVLESGYYHDKTLLDKCTELKRILISSLNTAKANQEKIKFQKTSGLSAFFRYNVYYHPKGARK